MNYKLKVQIIILGLMFLLPMMGRAEMRLSIEQYGITWTFDKEYECGQFVNGDWWVVVPVTIIGIDPPSREIDGRTKNGAMININADGLMEQTINRGRQGFDSAPELPFYAYDAAKNVALNVSQENPLELAASTSLLSSISNDAVGSPQISDGAVLTVLSNIPPSNSFRPAYAGSDKTIKYNLDDIDYSPLQNIQLTEDAPTMETVAGYFERPWFDWKGSPDGGRSVHPTNNMPNYGRDIAKQLGDAALLLNSNASNAEKELLLIRYLQYAIDLWGIYKTGIKWAWRQDGGHGPGRKLPILIAGNVLHDSDMAAVGSHDRGDPWFGEDQVTFYLSEYDAKRDVLPEGADFDAGGRYSLRNGTINIYRDHKDAYYIESDWTFVNPNGEIGLPEYSVSGSEHERQGRFISRNYLAGGTNASQYGRPSYRANATGNTFAASVLVAHSMGLKNDWNHDALFDYQDRWMEVSTWAIIDADMPEELRWPEDHPEGWFRAPGFHQSMWDTYRADYGTVWPDGASNPEPQPEPKPEPQPETEADPGQRIPEKTLLRISNNIIKSGGNTTVTINCDVKDAGKLTVKIYDSSGKEIITLLNKHEESGIVTIIWTGVDSGGSKIGSGIYMVHMRAGSYEETKKIAVIK